MRALFVVGLLLLSCGNGRHREGAADGSAAPHLAPLGAARARAIGRVASCTGTLVAPRRVLTARHCHVRTTDAFCQGAHAGARARCTAIAAVATHPDVDVALVTLSEDASAEPIPLLDEDLDERWVGRAAEWAGVGEREDGRRRRAFVVEPIVAVTPKYILVGAPPRRGACFGDSGGPLLVVAERRELRIAGVLHAGDPSCHGEDEYTRVDVARGWLRDRMSD